MSFSKSMPREAVIADNGGVRQHGQCVDNAEGMTHTRAVASYVGDVSVIALTSLRVNAPAWLACWRRQELRLAADDSQVRLNPEIAFDATARTGAKLMNQRNGERRCQDSMRGPGLNSPEVHAVYDTPDIGRRHSSSHFARGNLPASRLLGIATADPLRAWSTAGRSPDSFACIARVGRELSADSQAPEQRRRGSDRQGKTRADGL